jgi:hypothetical protein
MSGGKGKEERRKARGKIKMELKKEKRLD